MRRPATALGGFLLGVALGATFCLALAMISLLIELAGAAL